MKTITVLLLSGAMLSQAALIPFGVSPAGSSAAVGLNPTNEVPALSGTGSGGELPGGVVFDTDSNTLHVSLGYGSAQGFGNLTGPITTAGIFGPAQTNQTAAVLYDLASLTVPAGDPALGGTISGDVIYSTNDIAGLLAGLNYVNLATSNNPTGEIRGQLIPLDIPPVLTCPDATNVPCGTSVTLTAGVGDQVGNSVTVVWSLNGVVVQTNEVPAFSPPATTNVTFSGVLPSGTNSVSINAENAAGSVADCTTTVVEVDTNPPVIISAAPSRSSLWPPNHKMVKINVTAQTTDNCSAVTWKIIGVTSNEAVDAKGSGHTAPDWQILDDHSVNLRAERAGPGSGRVYTISLQAQDSVGNLSTTNTITVTVPHSKGKGNGNNNNPGNGNGNGNGNNGNGNGHSNGHGKNK